MEQALAEWEGFDESGNLKTQSVDALQMLWKGERLSIAQMIEKLGTMSNAREADELAVAILSFSGDGQEALIAALQSDNKTLVTNAARGLIMTTNEDWPIYPVLFGT